MEIKVIQGDVVQLEADALVVNLFEGVKQPGGATGVIDKALDGAITQLIVEGEVRGKLEEITLIHTMGKIRAKRVVVVGLGKPADFTLDRVRRVMGETCRFLRRKGVKRAATTVHGAGIGGLEPEKAAQAVAEGSLLGLYTFNQHQARDPEGREIAELLLVEQDAGRIPDLERGFSGAGRWRRPPAWPGTWLMHRPM